MLPPVQYLLMGQASQVASPAVVVDVPAAQVVHALAPAEEDVVAAQAVLTPPTHELPAGHEMHEDCAVCVWY